jgi:D-alanyl-lipoteichoic acid acyltransferase DltB (MBOAT superfamily)
LLFNSFPFIFVFLPIALVGFFALAGISHRLAAGWLTAASLAFYGWWDPNYIALLLASVGFNYVLGSRIARLHEAGQAAHGRRLLTFAIVANLALLGYFKYAIFFMSGMHKLGIASGPLPQIILPLGISFFTITQIAFLVDAHRGLAREYNFVHYMLFVTYFPHLIAGPILHHKEMMPQFGERQTYRLNWDNIAVGLTMFIFGLFKKTVIADEMAGFATPAFDAAAAGTHLSLLEAWGAALAYTFQIYFDFSGYTDMALGASRMFGIVLPLNFNSPYKASSIIEFWRRWHITLSRFLRDYLYIPLGGNRSSRLGRYRNLMLTMLIGGLWHGAEWTFVFWGGLHGAYLVVNHGWRSLRGRVSATVGRGERALATLLTFVAVVVAWVFFRASDFTTATSILSGMAGGNGVVLPTQWQLFFGGASDWLGRHEMHFGALQFFDRVSQSKWLLFLLVFCWVAPNTQQVLAAFRPALLTSGYDDLAIARPAWRPTPAWTAGLALLATVALLSIERYSEFIYFRF